jgi:hypothetical protein
MEKVYAFMQKHATESWLQSEIINLLNVDCDPLDTLVDEGFVSYNKNTGHYKFIGPPDGVPYETALKRRKVRHEVGVFSADTWATHRRELHGAFLTIGRVLSSYADTKFYRETENLLSKAENLCIKVKDFMDETILSSVREHEDTQVKLRAYKCYNCGEPVEEQFAKVFRIEDHPVWIHKDGCDEKKINAL